MGVLINDLGLLKYCETQIAGHDLPEIGETFPTDKCVCFGEYYPDHSPFWMVTFYNFNDRHDCMIDLCLNIRGVFPPSLFKKMGRVVFDYAFDQAGLERCTVNVRASNKPSLKLARAWGFKDEGIKRNGYKKPRMEDMWILGMLRSECKWIGEK